MRNFILNKKESKELRNGKVITRERGNYIYTISPAESDDNLHVSITLKPNTRIIVRDSHTLTLHYETARLAKRGDVASQDFDGETINVIYDNETQQFKIAIQNDYRVITQ